MNRPRSETRRCRFGTAGRFAIADERRSRRLQGAWRAVRIRFLCAADSWRLIGYRMSDGRSMVVTAGRGESSRKAVASARCDGFARSPGEPLNLERGAL